MKNIIIFGGNGSIGKAFINGLSTQYPTATLYAISRDHKKSEYSNPNIIPITIDYGDETALYNARLKVTKNNSIDMIIIATGVLQNKEVNPEKSLRDITSHQLHYIFEINTVIPTLILKHFAPYLNKNKRSVCAILSARVGSISDNHLGGWYAYRMSKSALNMVIKNTAIEIKRTHAQSIIVGLHPGTVDTPLSKPYQHHIAKQQLFTPQYAIEKMIHVLNNLHHTQTGKIIAYDGTEINP